jgi:hypothetical protein
VKIRSKRKIRKKESYREVRLKTANGYSEISHCVLEALLE